MSPNGYKLGLGTKRKKDKRALEATKKYRSKKKLDLEGTYRFLKNEVEQILRQYDVTDSDYLLMSSGSCNSEMFDPKSSDIDLELILDKDIDERTKSNIKKDVYKIQKFYTQKDESRVTFWFNSLENILNDDFKPATPFSEEATGEKDELEGWYGIGGQYVQFMLSETGKQISGNKKWFNKIKVLKENMEINPNLGAEIYATSLVNALEALFHNPEEIDDRKLSKAIIRSVLSTYISLNGEILYNDKEIRDVGECLFGYNEFSGAFSNVIKKAYAIKKGEKKQFEDKDKISIALLFKKLGQANTAKLNEIRNKNINFEESLSGFYSKRLDKILKYDNLEFENNAIFLKMYGELLTDTILQQGTLETFQLKAIEKDLFESIEGFVKLVKDRKINMGKNSTSDSKLNYSYMQDLLLIGKMKYLKAIDFKNNFQKIPSNEIKKRQKKVKNYQEVLNCFKEAVNFLEKRGTVKQPDLEDEIEEDESKGAIKLEKNLTESNSLSLFYQIYATSLKEVGNLEEAVNFLEKRGTVKQPDNTKLWNLLAGTYNDLDQEVEGETCKLISNALNSYTVSEEIETISRIKKCQYIERFKGKLENYLKIKLEEHIANEKKYLNSIFNDRVKILKDELKDPKKSIKNSVTELLCATTITESQLNVEIERLKFLKDLKNKFQEFRLTDYFEIKKRLKDYQQDRFKNNNKYEWLYTQLHTKVHDRFEQLQINGATEKEFQQEGYMLVGDKNPDAYKTIDNSFTHQITEKSKQITSLLRDLNE